MEKPTVRASSVPTSAAGRRGQQAPIGAAFTLEVCCPAEVRCWKWRA